MAMHGDSHVISGNAIIMWDGITRPEEKEGGVKQYSLKVAVMNNAPEINDLNNIGSKALREDSKFKGNLPPGGCWPILAVDPTSMEGRLPSHVAFNAKSNRIPQVFDQNGQELSPMVYGSMLYPGAIVKVLVHAFTFDNKSKGVAFGLDGIQIVDANAPKLPVAGGIDAAAVFGTGQPAGMPPGAGQPAGMPPGAGAMPPTAGAMPPGVGQPAGMPPGVQPAPDFLKPKIMTPKAGGATYEQFTAQGWTDEAMIQQGYMMP